jgi:uncharacterized protein (TIGR02646 family)
VVELHHRSGGVTILQAFLANHPRAQISDWDSQTFQPVKRQVKQALHEDQQGLCIYCERKIDATDGQIDHIKPKSGPHADPYLCFIYTNHAHSCINNKTCGQKKKHGLLPIEPGPGCNRQWTLSTDGAVEPVAGLTRHQKHGVTQTRGMLGLNADARLVDERQKWLTSSIEVLKASPEDITAFLQDSPFRHILATVL